MQFKNITIDFLKGIFIGIGAIIPGVSGGTAAIIIGKFEDILEATGNFFKHIRNSLLVLIPIFLGVVTGVFLMSKPLKYISSEVPYFSKFLFCTLALISAVLFLKKSINITFSIKKSISLIVGSIFALSISFLLSYMNFNIENDIISLLCIGIPLSLALVLPAISFSYILLFFGLYDKTLSAISELDLYFLIPLGTGILLGSFIFSKLFLKLVDNCSEETYSFVFGFVLCSIIDLLL